MPTAAALLALALRLLHLLAPPLLLRLRLLVCCCGRGCRHGEHALLRYGR